MMVRWLEYSAVQDDKQTHWDMFPVITAERLDRVRCRSSVKLIANGIALLQKERQLDGGEDEEPP